MYVIIIGFPQVAPTAKLGAKNKYKYQKRHIEYFAGSACSIRVLIGTSVTVPWFGKDSGTGSAGLCETYPCVRIV